MAADVKNFGYVLNEEGSKRLPEVKPVGKEFLKECRETARKYPRRVKRED